MKKLTIIMMFFLALGLLVGQTAPKALTTPMFDKLVKLPGYTRMLDFLDGFRVAGNVKRDSIIEKGEPVDWTGVVLETFSINSNGYFDAEVKLSYFVVLGLGLPKDEIITLGARKLASEARGEPGNRVEQEAYRMRESRILLETTKAIAADLDIGSIFSFKAKLERWIPGDEIELNATQLFN